MHLFMPFYWIYVYLFYKGRGKEDGVGGWGLTGTHIDMSSFYLFSLESRRHSQTTLHNGVSPLAEANVYQNHLHDNKYKKIIKPEHIILANRFIVARELFPFIIKHLLMNLFQGLFVPLHCATLLCII